MHNVINIKKNFVNFFLRKKIDLMNEMKKSSSYLKAIDYNYDLAKRNLESRVNNYRKRYKKNKLKIEIYFLKIRELICNFF